MKTPENALWFGFPSDDPELDVTCPECKEVSKLGEWTDSTNGCWECGDHAAIVCPRCGHKFDHVWDGDAFYPHVDPPPPPPGVITQPLTFGAEGGGGQWYSGEKKT